MDSFNDNFAPISIDPIQLTDSYLNKNDWRTKENQTSTFSIGALIQHQFGRIGAEYWLNKVYPPEIATAHRSCDLHIHDLSFMGPYCAGWSLQKFLEEGMNGVENKIASKPANHMFSAMQQIVNYIGCMALEWAGAQAFNQVDTCLAPFIRKDNMTDKEIEQCIQTLLFSINIPSRWGGQAPFSNITLDITVPEDMKNETPIIGGKKMPFKYGDLQEEMNRFNLILFAEFSKGDAKGSLFQYPIPTIQIDKNFQWDSPVSNKLFELDARYGLFYFGNFISSDMSKDDVRSMCCRLRLDLAELKRRGGGLFGASSETGSIGVVTLNLPKIGYLSKTKEEMYERLDALMVIAKDSLEIKRKKLNEWLELGLYPYTRRYLQAGFENHFNTIGIVGMNEFCRNYFKNTKKKDWGIQTDEGIKLSKEMLTYMKKRLSDFQVETGNLYNLEATPAESTSFRLALHDKKKHPDILTAGTVANPYYTNSTNLPVGYTSDPWAAIKHQDQFQTEYTGGSVLHLFADSNNASPEVVKGLIKKALENSAIPYYSYSPTVRVCKHGHGLLSSIDNETCPFCREEIIASYTKKLGELQAKKANIENELQEKGIQLEKS